MVNNNKTPDVMRLVQIMSNFLTLSNKQLLATCLLHYVLNMANIYEESSEGIIINSNIIIWFYEKKAETESCLTIDKNNV